MTVQTVRLVDLHPHPVRTQLPDVIPIELITAFKKKGIHRAPLIAPNGAVIDGQKVVEAAILLGKTDIQVFVFDESWTDGIAHLAALHRFSMERPTPRRIWEIYTALKPFLYLRTAERRAAQLAGQEVPDRPGRYDVADALGVSEAEATQSIYLYNRTLVDNPDLPRDDLNQIIAAVEAGLIPAWTAGARINDILRLARARKSNTYSPDYQTRALTGLTQEGSGLTAAINDLGQLHPGISPDVLTGALDQALKLRSAAYQLVKSLRIRLDSPDA